MTGWIERPAHHAWLDAECRRLLTFGLDAGLVDGGAAYLDGRGTPDPSQGVATWLTARAAHVYSLGSLLGFPGAGLVADDAIAGLRGRLRDAERGGWFRALLPDGSADLTAGKACYDHAFVMLAASSAVLAERAGAAELLDEATAVFLERFWDDEVGLVVDAWDRDFARPDDYRGLNSTMHSVEAMLAVADAVPADRAEAWRRRAERAARFVVGLVDAHDGRLPEHFGSDWTPHPDLNRDRPDDQFKPFGATPGHGLEWSRLLLHLEAAIGVDDGLLAAAVALFERAVADGWAVDGADGFVYTTDWDGGPVVRHRMHWVVAEAICAAAALHRRTGDASYAAWYRTFWDYAARYLLDLADGSWQHELDPGNRPSAAVWSGKPDLYHAVQATLLPRLPLAPTVTRGVADGLLGATALR